MALIPSLTLICPTIDRSSLFSVIRDVAPQLEKGDEFLVVGDGPCPRAEAWVKKARKRGVKYIGLPKPTKDWGCTPCDVGIAAAKGDFIFFIGDDDSIEPGAFKAIKRRLSKKGSGDVPHIFAMYHGSRKMILSGSIEPGKVSGQQIVVPNVKEKIPRMADWDGLERDKFSDWWFIMRTVDAWGGKVQYHADMICMLPQQNLGVLF